MEPQIQVTSNVPFDEQIVGIFGDEKVYTQFSASGINILTMAVCCIKAAAQGISKTNRGAEEIAAVIGAISVVLTTWTITEHTKDPDQAMRESNKIEKKILDIIRDMSAHDLLAHDPVAFTRVVVAAAMLVRNETK